MTVRVTSTTAASSRCLLVHDKGLAIEEELEELTMKKDLNQESGIGRALCVVGLLAIAFGVIELIAGINDASSLGKYYRDLGELVANLRIAGSIGSVVAGLLLLAVSEIIRYLGDIATAVTNGADKISNPSDLPTL